MDGAVSGGRRGTGDHQVSRNAAVICNIHTLPTAGKNPKTPPLSSVPATSENIRINSSVPVASYSFLAAVLARLSACHGEHIPSCKLVPVCTLLRVGFSNSNS